MARGRILILTFLRDALSERSSRPDPNRLKPIRQVAAELAQELNRFAPCAAD
jgi:hypothetical protein